MTELFADIFENITGEMNEIKPGSILRGTVIEIDNNSVTVDVGLKSESVISIYQFKNNKGELEVEIGDETEVALDAIEDGCGNTVLSREKAKRHKCWKKLETAFTDKKQFAAILTAK